MYIVTKRIFQTLFAIIGFAIVILNVRLRSAPTYNDQFNQDVIKQLHHLQNEIWHHDAAARMQDQFPEGFLFLHAVYALAWADEVARLPQGHALRTEASSEIRKSTLQILSDAGKQPFSSEMPLPHGAFYCGWAGYVAGRYLQLTPKPEQDSTIKAFFFANCAAIDTTIRATTKPWLESYLLHSWPADNVICLATLQMHDVLFEPRYTQTRADWLTRIKANTDTLTGLTSHESNFHDSKEQRGVRGSSQCLILSFLPMLDSVWAADQYTRYKQHFVLDRLGLPAIGEYPHHTTGASDIDSGPVIWGVGAVSSMMGMKAAMANRDTSLHLGLRRSIEAFGMPHSTTQYKVYLFGTLPMADAFIAWSNAGAYLPGQEGKADGSALLVHLISFAIVLFLVLFIKKM